MSFDLGFWFDRGASTAESAVRIYHQLVEGQVGVVEETGAIARFYRDVVAIYPELGEDDMDDSPWACELYVTSECLIASISWSRVDEVVPVLLDLAARHGLTAYDPQEQVVRVVSA